MAAYKQLTASGQITPKGSVAKLVGYEVVVALSAAAVNIREGSATGAILMVIPASSALGTRANLSDPIAVIDGLYAEFGGTGTVNFLFG